jgi:hypothetical protein
LSKELQRIYKAKEKERYRKSKGKEIKGEKGKQKLMQCK